MDSSQNQRSIVCVNSEPDPCPICKDEVTDRALTNTCLHEFCLKCLKDWSEIPHNTCPVCRQKYRNIISNIKSNDVFDLIIISTFDMSFIETIWRAITHKVCSATREERIVFNESALHSERPHGLIASKIEQILADNEWILAAVTEHKKICDETDCVLTDISNLPQMSHRIQNFMFVHMESLCHQVFTNIDDIPHNDMIEEILLSILQYKRQEFVYFLRYYFKSYENFDTDFSDTDSTMFGPPDSQYSEYDSSDLDSDSDSQNDDNSDSDGQNLI